MSISSLYDEIFAAIYESVSRRSYGSELDGFLGATLGLAGAVTFWLVTIYTLAHLAGLPVASLARPAHLIPFAVAPILFDLTWFSARGRYKKAVTRFRQQPAPYQRRVALLAWTFSLLPFILTSCMVVAIALFASQS